MFDIFYYGNKPNLFAIEKPASSLEQAAKMSKTKFFWYIYGGNNYANFNFDWCPPPWEQDHLHVWPSQWQRNGGVYFAKKSTAHLRQYHFRTDQLVTRYADKSLWVVPDNIDDSGFDYSWHPDETEPDYEYHFGTQWQRDGGPVYPGTAGVKYMLDQKIRANATQIFYVDFLNSESTAQFEQLKQHYPSIKSTRYVDNHLNVLKRIANMATTEFVWVISSICDYRHFDFTWHPAPEQREMIHCFGSNNQKRGDTFYIHVPSFRQQMFDLELLDWFNVINYCEDQRVFRYPYPCHNYTSDNLVEEIRNYNFTTPYALFTNYKFLVDVADAPCLWTRKDRTVVRMNSAGSTVLVPRDIKADLRTQIYDYPYIETSKRKINNYLGSGSKLDIVYISNGEPDEEHWYEHTRYQTNSDVKWVRGVKGRVAAYQEAARQSTTPWFFAVFAKLEVKGTNTFPWNEWSPDYFQQPKHYIFNARNPVNGLEYGHMGVIAYNRNLVLANNTPGIDFTLSQPHESVPLLSAVAHYNQDAWTTWRTAFREVVKLKHFEATASTVDNTYRLHQWLTVVNDLPYAEWSLRGAEDAVEYYNSVNGEYSKLMFTFEWDWLRNYYMSYKQYEL